jgi:CDP-diacylglycerol--serine O-phosphatidyltransferase
MTKQLPNFFTLLNLFFGCMAIVSGLQSDLIVMTRPDGQLYVDIPEKIWMVSLFIGLSALVDFLDGFLARALQADSAMGKQLDSLADLVSFGVAPALLLFHFLRLAWAQQPDGMELSSILLWPAFFIPLAAAWRLARFNIEKSVSSSFSGLPVPAAGIFIASLPLIYWNVQIDFISSLSLIYWNEQIGKFILILQNAYLLILQNAYFLYAIIVMLSLLMVSRIPLLSFKFSSFSWGENQPRYLLIIVSVPMFLVLQWLALPLIIVLYVLLSLLFKNKLA